MQITIRAAEPHDCDRISELLAQIGDLHHRSRPDIFQPNIRKYTPEQLLEILNTPEKPIFVAVIDNEANGAAGFVVGYVFCQILNYQGHPVFNSYKTLYIDDICVDEQLRSKGVGSLLLEKCKDLAKEHDCYCIDLNVWKFNEDAIKFYEKCGFNTRSIRMEYIIQQ